MNDQINAGMSTAEVPCNVEPATEPRAADRSEQPENAHAAQAAQRPAFEMIATAYDPHGQNPHHVSEFDHASGRRVRRLLPVHALTSDKRTRDILIKAGVPSPVASATATLTAIASNPPSATGLHDVPHGWVSGCDFGTIYRYGNTAFSSLGPINVYADGLAPEPQQNGDITQLLETLALDHTAATVILVAAHLASLLIHLLDQTPLVIVASGLPEAELQRLTVLADFMFGTRVVAPLLVRRSDTDDALIQFMCSKSRKQAFAHAKIRLDASATTKTREKRIGRAHAPVTLIVTTDANVPGNLASPTPPSGCIEMYLDAPNQAAPTAITQVSSNVAVHHEAIAAVTYIQAVLLNQDKVVRNADTNLPKLIDRYLSAAAGVQNESYALSAVRSFALLRYALTCGRQYGVAPWTRGVADEVMDTCVKRWAAHHRDRETAFERRVIDAVNKLLSTGNHNQRTKFNDCEVRLKSINGHELMLIDSGTFDASVVGRLDKARVLDALRKRRLLVTNGDGSQYQVRVDGGRSRFYAIDVAALRSLHASGMSNPKPAQAAKA
ncbi:hypothetical protein [Paraburkholderia tropica]|uniref:Uncharacterized protein n=1 Tax=Paraburkholderia tropica TaxID=92647 RepID=A0AAQ1GFZ1_9BURK|nr:hypothetical protein [Paraburkholderia tropica]RQN40815.1 hypothetical protein EHZ25_00715 [Paraburkholderia tropica]SEJ74355.1 hypothetical protein SAMN05216550_1086 [Paraburkholderia tropica]